MAIDPVAKLRNQLLRRPTGIVGLVFSTAGFTEATSILAQYSASQPILLWNGRDIGYALGRQQLRVGLLRKYRYCVERGLSDYSLKSGGMS